jgi:hypothetical protein
MAVAVSQVDESGAKVSAPGKSGKPVRQTEQFYYLLAVGIVMAGALASFILEHEGWHVSIVKLQAGVSAFAALYVGSQLIERILVPIAPIAAQTKVSDSNSSAPMRPGPAAAAGDGADVQAHMAAGPPVTGFITRRTAAEALTEWSKAARAAVPGPATAEQKEPVARQQAVYTATWAELLQQAKQNGNTTLWAIGTSLGMLIAAAGNVHVIRILATNWKWAWIDILVTGLVLGGGSKNLHDFIGTLQNRNAAPGDSSSTSQTATGTT